MGLSRILALAVLLAATWSGSAFAAGKYALVVGNSDYQRAGKLPNASSDAELIAAKLASVGFEVDKLIDAGEDALGEALDKMARKVDGADAVALYFAGHGLQKDGVNYLVPVDAKLETETAIERETISLQSFLDVMERAPIGLVFLDACRNNPFAEALLQTTNSSGRSANVGRGLAVVRPRGDLLVTFATLPNTVASDGALGNSPFARALAKHMTVPDVEISVLMKRVTKDVMDETKGTQRPQQLSQMQREFYFQRTSADSTKVEREEGVRTILSVYPAQVKTGEEISVLAEVPMACQSSFLNLSPIRKVATIPAKFFKHTDPGAGRNHFEISPGSRYGLIVQEEDERGRNLIGFFCVPPGLEDKEDTIGIIRELDAKLSAGTMSGTVGYKTFENIAYHFNPFDIH